MEGVGQPSRRQICRGKGEADRRLAGTMVWDWDWDSGLECTVGTRQGLGERGGNPGHRKAQ